MTDNSLPNSKGSGNGATVLRRAAVALPAFLLAVAAWSQESPELAPGAQTGEVRGIYNWIHTTGNADAAFAFYHDVFDIELAPSPFYGAGAPAPERIRPVSEAGSDELVWQLTNTEGARFRTAFMRAPNTPFGLELSEFFDIPRSTRPANPWDPGASILIFAVRDLEAVVERLAQRDAPIVTAGAAPVALSAGRSIVVRNPDGYLIQVVQASRDAIDGAASPGIVVETSIGITVASLSRALAFYRELLGFEVGVTRQATDDELALYGLTAGELTQTPLSIPGTNVTVLLSEFTLPPSAATRAMPFRWRIQDVGAPQFQLEVTGLDPLLRRTADAGYAFLSVGGQPIQRPFGRFVFAIDADGVLVEYVEPAGPRGER